ncbi:B-cell receptor CD22-like [Trichomycterus rosablanca]|uniref:B-cell receptor CD22-like n=1 Tax=Trichomycterus rosablanca TaxID=2290929 RepID=UPI002F35960F
MQKFSDDTAIVGCVRDGQEDEYRNLVKDFAVWCRVNHLQLNASKAKEMVVDFRRSGQPSQPVSIEGSDVEVVKTYKFLGVHLDDKLDWSANTDILYRKGQSRLYFLRRLRSFNICRKLLHMFYQSVVASVLFYAVLCWGGSIKNKDEARLDKLISRAGAVVGIELESLVTVAERRTLSKLHSIMDIVNHPLHTVVVKQRRTLGQWSVTYTPQNVCALNGSAVFLNCSYTYPSNGKVTDAFWTINAVQLPNLTSQSGYSGRVEYFQDQGPNKHAVRIRDVRNTDERVYYFRFVTNLSGGKYTGSSGVTLNVTVLQVIGSQEVTEGQPANLTCNTTCNLTDPPTFVWFRNGLNLTTNSTNSSLLLNPVSSADAGSYSCAVKGYKQLRSPDQTLTVRYPPRNVSATISPSGGIVEGILVNLTCYGDANPQGENYTWFKGETLLGKGKTYSFSSINSNDSGDYKCQCSNKYGDGNSTIVTLNVLYPPRNVSVSISPSGGILEGSLVNLTCTGDANPPEVNYTWFKGETMLGKGQTYRYSSINSKDSGDYKCQCSNKYGDGNSTTVTLDVLYAPRNVSVSISPSGGIVEGSSVNLTCIGDANPPGENYTLFKSETLLGQGQTYSFSSINSKDSGDYKCQCSNKYGDGNSTGVTLDVLYPPRNISVSISPSGEIVKGSSVNLTCNVDANPQGENYTWFKGETLLGKGKIYSFSSVNSKDSGDYKCHCSNKYGDGNSTAVTLDVLYPPKNVSVSISPSGGIVEGSSVNLTCSGDGNPPEVNYTWFKEGETSPVGYEKVYVASQSGSYYCQAQNVLNNSVSAVHQVTVEGNQYEILYIVLPIVATMSPEEILFGNVPAASATSAAPPAETAPPAPSTEVEEAQYANVHNSREVLVDGQGDDVHYASVTFTPNSAAYRNVAADLEDHKVIYSTVK